MQAADLLRQGLLDEGLQKLKEEVRADPANPRLRVAMFETLSVLGDWEKALVQLNIVSDLDAETRVMAHVYRSALQAAAFRQEVFAGRRTPVIFGEPSEWMAWLINASQHAAAGDFRQAREVRDKALEVVPTTPGSIGEQPIQWIADGDSRIGPFIEAVVEGKYYWVPFCRISAIRMEPPHDLRDLVWSVAKFTWANGGEAVGLIPVCYPGAESTSDAGLRLGRRTEWSEPEPTFFIGAGQRMLVTDSGDHALLQVRRVDIGSEPVATGEQMGHG